jgi:shikimate dehydrogenase
MNAPPLAGVVGWPIGHSLSPRVHAHWLARYRIAGFYVPIGLAPEEFAEGLRSLPRLGFRGVNVTIPHKEAALALADEATEAARRIGAANTLTFTGGAIRADNTDAYGFVANLRQQAPGWRAAAGPALVFGAGGAARAVVAALLGEGAPEVRVVNRTPGRAAAIAAELGAGVAAIDWADAASAARGAATVVNTTALGMDGGAGLPPGLEAAPPAALVTDVVYGREPTPFLAEARRLGFATVDGLGMLLHQAAPGFERWFGRRPEVDEALRAAVLAP